jgi:hypothetical protein
MVTSGHALTESLFTSCSNCSCPLVNLIYLPVASVAARRGAPAVYSRPLIKILAIVVADLRLRAVAANGQPLDNTVERVYTTHHVIKLINHRKFNEVNFNA